MKEIDNTKPPDDMKLPHDTEQPDDMELPDDTRLPDNVESLDDIEVPFYDVQLPNDSEPFYGMAPDDTGQANTGQSSTQSQSSSTGQSSTQSQSSSTGQSSTQSQSSSTGQSSTAGQSKNKALIEVVETAIANLTPSDTPEYIAEQITHKIEQKLLLWNLNRAKGNKLGIPETLPNSVIARLMNEMFEIRRIACAGLDADEKFDLLCLYQSEGPNAGIYIESENALYQLAIRYNMQLTKNGFDEVAMRLRAIAPRVTRTINKDLIPVNNGVFDFKKKELLPFSPDYIFLAKSHVDYDPSAGNVTIHNAEDGTDWDLESWIDSLSDDVEIVDLIWELLSAIIRPFVRWDKSVWFYSEVGNNGKGTLCTLMEQLCGGTVAAIPISDFGKDFMLEPLTTATAIIVHENDVGKFIDKVANLKAAVTGDAIYINRKFLTPVRYKFFGLMVQCVNEMPRIKDKSNSFYRRQLIVPFDKCFTGRERKYIKEDYLTRPEVLRYVLYRVLHMNHYELSEPEACKALMQEYKEYNDPVRQFFLEMEYQFVWDLLPFDFLYDLYKAWFLKNCPRGIIQNKKTFTKEISDVCKESEIWYCESTRKQIRPCNRMDKSEPLIVQYELDDWKNPKYVGGNIELIARPALKDKYRGLQRRDNAPKPSCD